MLFDSLPRALLYALAWVLSVINLVISCVVAATGHWKPRAASVFSAVVAGITDVLAARYVPGPQVADHRQLAKLLLTGLWLGILNKFHCRTRTSVVEELGFSLYGHTLTPSGAPREALINNVDMFDGDARDLVGRRLRSRCRLFKGVLGTAIPIFVLLLADLIWDMFRVNRRTHVLPRSHSSTPSVASVSSVGSPRIASATHPGHHPVRDAVVAETKV
ncbi:hypothetical protein DL89DRAFT_264852 [Linderina pennispora]|uniref:Uncharacterized protein n=1 Tax=Linderina pennispora TaxID=61395 RepID=A0A1Y1WHC9_9FUNG|nr:uncharacterized protein DL89DRAFT_264852 [Linderina pennispora]ORX72636.1 hypothetical protein DL89DRAFT_264852 [Linderina pennispora]